MSRVDVIVPCYNYGRFLRQCVESVLTQEGVEVRVLILDDESHDDTERVGSELAKEDRRVEYRRHGANRGHINTYNEGIDWLSGDYCILLSADDMLLPGALGRAAALMDAHPQVGLTHGLAIETGHPDPTRDSPLVTSEIEVRDGTDFIGTMCQEGYNIVHTPTAIGRTSVQRTIGHYRPELPHTGDMEMWLRYATRSSVAFIASHQAYYRRHGASMSIGHRGVRDLQQVKMAFDITFDRCGGGLPSGLRRLADRRVAEAAYGRACKAFEAGDMALCAEFAEFARAAHPRCRCDPKWLRLRCKRLIGPRLWSRLRPWCRRTAHPTAERATANPNGS
jgi:glycosyltransferase involved in cell wall biosynthesis